MKERTNFACYSVTKEVLALLENEENYSIFRMVPSSKEVSLDCPIFSIYHGYWRDLVYLDKDIGEYTKNYPGNNYELDRLNKRSED